jgi:Leucine-rich repeat (LRR) protein
MSTLPLADSDRKRRNTRHSKNNLIKTVPAVILVGITHLNLQNCNLGFIAQDLIDAMMYLRRADLHGNCLRTLPRFPSTLEHLAVGNNELRTLPDHICMLPVLQTLDLSQNLLTVLPVDGFAHLTHLVYLFLAGNLLTEFPRLPIQKLKACSITYNCIPGLPAEFKQAESTKKATPEDFLNATKFLRIYYPNWSMENPV